MQWHNHPDGVGTDDSPVPYIAGLKAYELTEQWQIAYGLLEFGLLN